MGLETPREPALRVFVLQSLPNHTHQVKFIHAQWEKNNQITPTYLHLMGIACLLTSNHNLRPLSNHNRRSLVCMFDKFHFTFNFKSKVSHDVLKNKNKCQVTYTFYFKMSPQFLGYKIFKKKNTILVCNHKNYQPSISILWSHMFLQMLKIVAQTIASTSSPQRETRIRASRVFKFNHCASGF